MAVDKPIIVVVHGTSKQGTSVVISLLQTNKFVVKAITRDASSDSELPLRIPLAPLDFVKSVTAGACYRALQPGACPAQSASSLCKSVCTASYLACILGEV